ncbi:Lsr2 dimerization domain-containing protein [Streptomyces roseolus]|uniref:Lsr2 dimerization domain-containing protein n=1 Tax=Streptomyces roseolus TaxID=67358 RepID=UPI001673E592|nr:histone-like nucleoid-structuring protein Lsr2 [Streptomyces roseolus]
MERATTTIGGLTLTTYARLERVDDIDGKTTENVVEVEMLIPVEDEDAEEDGPAYIFNRAVVDMGEATLKRYLKVIEPYAEKARLLPATPSTPQAASTGASRSRELTEWGHRAKKWLRGAGHEVKDRGRVPAHLEAIYVKNNPNDPKPE